MSSDITKLAKSQLRLQFNDDNNPPGSPHRADVVWDTSDGQLLWMDDRGGYSEQAFDEITQRPWYRVWVRGEVNQVDDPTNPNLQVLTTFYPADDIQSSTTGYQQFPDVGFTTGHVYLFGPQLEKASTGQLYPRPYFRASNPDYYDLTQTELWPQWTPDADIRTPRSKLSSKADLFSYYDPAINLEEYMDTSGAGEVQFYFYRRGGGTSNVFENRDPIQFSEQNPLYLGFVDWGDGSPIEFDLEPKLLRSGEVVKHLYEKPGTYEVKGYLFDTWRPKDDNGNLEDDLGIIDYSSFTARFRLQPPMDESIEGDSFIPYYRTGPVIGGISRMSVYYRTIARNLGYIFPPNYDNNTPLTEPIGLKFQFSYDQEMAESSLLKMDETLVGPMIAPFTASYYDQSDEEGNFDETIPRDETTLIYNGTHGARGELGKHIGNVDVSQPRMFTTGSFSIWDMLGFTNVPLDRSFGIIEGQGSVLISAPHGVENNRPTINALHETDDNTGAMAIEIARLTGAHVIYGQYVSDDPNFYNFIPFFQWIFGYCSIYTRDTGIIYKYINLTMRLFNFF